MGWVDLRWRAAEEEEGRESDRREGTGRAAPACTGCPSHGTPCPRRGYGFPARDRTPRSTRRSRRPFPTNTLQTRTGEGEEDGGLRRAWTRARRSPTRATKLSSDRPRDPAGAGPIRVGKGGSGARSAGAIERWEASPRFAVSPSLRRVESSGDGDRCRPKLTGKILRSPLK